MIETTQIAELCKECICPKCRFNNKYCPVRTMKCNMKGRCSGSTSECYNFKKTKINQ